MVWILVELRLILMKLMDCVKIDCSLTNNLDGGYGGKARKKLDVNKFFNKLGIVPDWDKIRYYILLDELF